MIFEGVATALITPFKDGKVDFDALERLLDFQLESGVDAVVALGTTGEPATLDESERERIISLAVRVLKGKIPVIVGCGSNNTFAAARAARRARELGADAALAVTPYYNKCTQRGLIDHFRAICKEGLPVICYNVPSRTGVNMLPETFGKLARETEGIAGIKEASGNMEQIEQCLREAGGAQVYSGDDGITAPVMAMGGAGVISVLSNVLPRETCEMAHSCLRGDFAAAAKLQLKLLPLIKALFCEVNPIPIKYAMSLIGFGDGSVRLPLTPLEEYHKKTLRELLENR